MLLYSFLLTVVLVVGAPYWLLRMALSGRYRAGLASRLGILPDGFADRVAVMRVERRGNGGTRPLMWVHAVSVGEVLAAARLIDELKHGEFQRVRPGTVFAVSTTTETAQLLAQERIPGCAVFYFPLDFAFAVRRYLKLLNPEMVVLIESELWPRLIAECEAMKIPVVVANARISDRSLPRYLRLKALWRPLLAKVALFLAQSEESADRLRNIGAPRVQLAGNLKYDAQPGKETPLVAALRAGIKDRYTVLVCGSTLQGEEAMLLDAWPAVLKASPQALLVIAPRHPARFDQVAGLVAARGFPLLRGSAYLRAHAEISPGSIFLLDTIGDLASMYGIAEAAFVGGSLISAGGHNPLEPAQFGVPVLMGQSFENFREIVEAMRSGDGIGIVTASTLAESLIGMVTNKEEAAAMGARGKAVSVAQTGAAARIATALLKLLPPRPGAPGARR
jgi:3-deoxy-D-manno-octulosonic-acid transferase